jgi:hypothetical protein
VPAKSLGKAVAYGVWRKPARGITTGAFQGKRIAGKGMYGTRIQAGMPESMPVRLPPPAEIVQQQIPLPKIPLPHSPARTPILLPAIRLPYSPRLARRGASSEFAGPSWLSPFPQFGAK